MYCPTCEVADMPGKFCSDCGGVLKERAPPCASCGNAEAFGPFCHMCGNSLLEDACPNCKAANQKGAFCKKCGHELRAGKDQKIPSDLAASTTVYCKSCYAAGKRHRSDGTRVRVCTVCGAPDMYLNFAD